MLGTYAASFAIALAACSSPSADAPAAGSNHGDLTAIAGRLGGVGDIDATAGSARFSALDYMTARGSTIYVSDGDAVRAIDATTGAVTTVAGVAYALTANAGSADGVGSAARFAAPEGLAVVGDTLYVADSGNHELRTIALATRAVSTPAVSATVGSPVGLATDGAGAIYIADFGFVSSPVGPITQPDTGGTIRKLVLATGEVTIVAGDPTAPPETIDGAGSAAHFQHPRDLVYDGAGHLITGDDCTLREIDLATGAVTTVAGNAARCVAADGTGSAAGFEGAYGLALEPGGAGAAGSSLVVADGSSTIRRVSLATWQVSTIAGAFDASGATDGVGSAARLSSPTGLAIAAGALVVADTDNTAIRRVDPSTVAVSTIAGAADGSGFADGTGATAQFAAPVGAAFDGDDTVYITDQLNNAVRAVRLSTGAVTTLAGSARAPGHGDGTGSAATLFQPAAVAYADGIVYFVEALDPGDPSLDARLRQIDVATGAVTTLAAIHTVISGIAYGDGALYYTDNAFSTVHAFDLATRADAVLAGAGGRTCGSADGVGSAAGFCAPSGIAFADGALYVVDNDTVRAIDVATATVTTIAGAAGVSGSVDGVGSAARFDDPVGVAVVAGTIYVADTFNSTLRAIEPATGAVSTAVGSPGELGVVTGPRVGARLNGPWGLADGGDRVIIIDIDENAVLSLQ